MHSGALFHQKCSEISTLLDSEQAEYTVNWSPRMDLLQVSGPRGGVVRPPRPPLATGLLPHRNIKNIVLKPWPGKCGGVSSNHCLNSFSINNTLTLSCPGTGRTVVNIGHSNLRPGSKKLTVIILERN